MESTNPSTTRWFPPIVPYFVIELVSPSDLKNQRYEDLQGKMQEYLDNGVRLIGVADSPAKLSEREARSVNRTISKNG